MCLLHRAAASGRRGPSSWPPRSRACWSSRSPSAGAIILNYEHSFTGFAQFLGDFKPAKILDSLNVTSENDGLEFVTHETVEYGGFLLMLDTVPEKSGYDYGENYKRMFSTFIPRAIWPTKPYYGRAAVGQCLDGRLRDETR